MDEAGLGSEMMITPQGVFRQFEAGTHVFSPKQTDMLYNLSKDLVTPTLPDFTGQYSGVSSSVPDFTTKIDINIENIEGNFDESILPQFKRLVGVEFRNNMTRWERDRRNDYRKLGGR